MILTLCNTRYVLMLGMYNIVLYHIVLYCTILSALSINQQITPPSHEPTTLLKTWDLPRSGYASGLGRFLRQAAQMTGKFPGRDRRVPD